MNNPIIKLKQRKAEVEAKIEIMETKLCHLENMLASVSESPQKVSAKLTLQNRENWGFLGKEYSQEIISLRQEREHLLEQIHRLNILDGKRLPAIFFAGGILIMALLIITGMALWLSPAITGANEDLNSVTGAIIGTENGFVEVEPPISQIAGIPNGNISFGNVEESIDSIPGMKSDQELLAIGPKTKGIESMSISASPVDTIIIIENESFYTLKTKNEIFTKKSYNINKNDCVQFSFSKDAPWAKVEHEFALQKGVNWFNKTQSDVNWTGIDLRGNGT